MSDRGDDRFSGRLRDFELDRPLRILLHHDRARADPIAVSDVSDAQLHTIAAALLAVDRQIEQRELAFAIGQLQAKPNGPNLPEFSRCLSSDQLALVPGIAGLDLQ